MYSSDPLSFVRRGRGGRNYNLYPTLPPLTKGRVNLIELERGSAAFRSGNVGRSETTDASSRHDSVAGNQDPVLRRLEDLIDESGMQGVPRAYGHDFADKW